MPTIKQILSGLVLAAGVLSFGQALADRPPSPEERSRIETMLRNEGFRDFTCVPDCNPTKRRFPYCRGLS
jgi:hypothetical protein